MAHMLMSLWDRRMCTTHASPRLWQFGVVKILLSESIGKEYDGRQVSLNREKGSAPQRLPAFVVLLLVCRICSHLHQHSISFLVQVFVQSFYPLLQSDFGHPGGAGFLPLMPVCLVVYNDSQQRFVIHVCVQQSVEKGF